MQEGYSRMPFKGKKPKLTVESLMETVFSEGLSAKLKNSGGTSRKKSKFEAVSSSLKSVEDKLKIFINLDSDPSIKKNMDFFITYVNSIIKETDNLKLSLEDLKKYYNNEGGV